MATFLTPSLIEQAHRIIDKSDQLEGFVPGEGSLTPKFVLVSEAPGAKEAQLSHGFQGPACTELNSWLTALGVRREEISITGAVRSRPFTETNGRKKDRRPSQEEIIAFAPLLDYELAQLPADTLLVPMGNTGLQRLLGRQMKISQVHGELIKSPVLDFHASTKRFVLGTRTYSVLPLFHPSYIRRFPSKRGLVNEDLAMLKSLL